MDSSIEARFLEVWYEIPFLFRLCVGRKKLCRLLYATGRVDAAIELANKRDFK